MRRKSIAFLVTLIMVLSLVIPQVSVFAADTGISVQFNNGNAAPNSNQIVAKFKVINNSSSALNLADLTLKYFYTKDSNVPQNFWCDHSGMMNGWNYIDVTSKVKGSFVDYKGTNTDTCLLVKFDSNAGSLPAGGSIEVQTRVAKTDWTNYNQSNDWSYKQLGSYGENMNVCAYKNGTKVYGNEPNGGQQQDPSINPTTATFDKGNQSDINVTLTPNGNTFKEISGLTLGSQYTVSGNTVTILKSYLATLSGIQTFTFDFGVSVKPTLAVTIKEKEGPGTPSISPANTTFDKGTASDVTVALTPNGNTFKGITGLTQGTDYTVSGNTVVLSKNYLNTLDVGTKALTFDFGVSSNPTFTITVTPPSGDKLIVAAGNVTGAPGSTVTLPITLTNVAKLGNVLTFNLYAGYDSKLLQATAVTAGDIVVNAPVNLSSQIADGSVSLVFLDNTVGSELITKDGTVATITFKILGTSKVTTPVTLTAGGFADAKSQRITKLSLVNGSVTIGDSGPSITPTTTSFDQGLATSDLSVALTPNGSTFNGITGLTKDTDYTVSGNSVTILKSYLNGLAAGTKVLTFDFGVTNNPTLTITVTPPDKKLIVAAGTVTGKPGDTITVPITLTNVADLGNILTFNLYAGYDSKLLQATAVTAGDIVVNAPVNLSSQIADGSVSLVFLDNTVGSELITKDGTLATITFKVLGTSKVTTPITLTAGGFADAKSQRITKLSLVNGSVTIDPVPVPSITPITTTFEQSKASDLSVTLTPNGSTFNGITGLTKDTDYTVSGNNVTILKDYLNGLAAGTKVLTFDFGGTSNPTLTITVTKPDMSLIVAAGTATGKPGDTITVPVTLTNVADVGNILTFNLYAGYDSKLLQATAVTAGDIVVNAPVNLSSQIADGSVSLVFLDNTVGSELITKDGTLATITFKVLGTSKVSTPVTLTAGGFADAKSQRITKLKLTSGSVSIIPSTDPSITPVTSSIVKGAATSDLSVALTLNDKTFNGITGLTQGTDYTVSGTTVAISKSYLNTLDVGTKVLTFDFGVTNNPTLTITVTPFVGTPSITPTTSAFDQGAATADLSVALTPNGNTFKGITGLTKGTDYTVSDNTVTIAKSYLNSLAVGTKALTFDFGSSSNPVLTITVNKVDTKLGLTIGNVSGKAGDTITVPVTLKNVAKAGNLLTFNFYVNYDPSLLEATSIKAGDIVVNAAVNLSTKISAEDGSLSFVFLDNTVGSELIKTDGTLATITFTVKGTSSTTAPLTIQAGGFANGDTQRISDITLNNGSVKLN